MAVKSKTGMVELSTPSMTKVVSTFTTPSKGMVSDPVSKPVLSPVLVLKSMVITSVLSVLSYLTGCPISNPTMLSVLSPLTSRFTLPVDEAIDGLINPSPVQSNRFNPAPP